MKNNKIKYGKKDLVGGPVAPREETVRISLLLEGDLLDALKARAAEHSKFNGHKVGYQTLMKQFLREALRDNSREKSTQELQKQIDDMQKTLETLVAKVAKPSKQKKAG